MYCTQAWLTRDEVLECLEKQWPQGQQEMAEVAFHHYEMAPGQEDVDSLPVLDGDVSQRLDTLNAGA